MKASAWECTKNRKTYKGLQRNRHWEHAPQTAHAQSRRSQVTPPRKKRRRRPIRHVFFQQGSTDSRTHGRTDARTHGRTDAWTHGRMDAWTRGRMEAFLRGLVSCALARSRATTRVGHYQYYYDDYHYYYYYCY